MCRKLNPISKEPEDKLGNINWKIILIPIIIFIIIIILVLLIPQQQVSDFHIPLI